MPSKRNTRKQREKPTKITLVYALPDRVSGLDDEPVFMRDDLPRTKEEMARLHQALGLDTMNDAQLKAIDEQYGFGADYHFPYDLIDAAMPEALMVDYNKVSPYAAVALERDNEAKEGYTLVAKVVAVIVPKAPSESRLQAMCR